MPFKKGEIPKGSKPFKKGQTGNPNGRPKLPELKTLMAQILGDEKEGKTAALAMLESQRAKAVRGDLKATEFLFKYGFGQAPQQIDITTQGEKIRNDNKVGRP